MGLIKSISHIELSSIRLSSELSIKNYATIKSSGLMSIKVFKMVVEAVKYFTAQKTQGSITLSGLGNSELNPEQSEMISYIKTIISNLDIKIKTNFKYDIIIDPIQWINQGTPEAKYNSGPCPSIFNGEVFIAYNGDIHNCFLDTIGNSVKVNIMRDDITKYKIEPFDLCKKCFYEAVI